MLAVGGQGAGVGAGGGGQGPGGGGGVAGGEGGGVSWHGEVLILTDLGHETQCQLSGCFHIVTQVSALSQ